jgi:hypothetical protein
MKAHIRSKNCISGVAERFKNVKGRRRTTRMDELLNQLGGEGGAELQSGR